MLKTTCIYSLTLVNTPCNLWQRKIPLAKLSKSQGARQKLWNVQFLIAVLSAAGDVKMRMIIFLETCVPETLKGIMSNN